MKNIKPLHILFGGAGLAALGTMLPWVTVTIKMMNLSNTVLGISFGAGKIVFVMAAAAAVLPVIKQPGKEKLMTLISMICAGVAALVAVMNLINGASATSDIPTDLVKDSGFSASVGIGLYLCVLGSLAAGWGAFNLWKAAPAPQNPGPPPLPPQG